MKAVLASSIHPIGTPQIGLSPNTGPLAASAWLAALDIVPPLPRWSVEIVLPAADDSRFKLELYSEEWGYTFAHRKRLSWIRVTDIRFIHGRDDHDLLTITPPLRSIDTLVAELEKRFDLAFDRERAEVRTNIPGAERVLLDWVRGL